MLVIDDPFSIIICCAQLQKPTHPAFNVVANRVQSVYEYFSKLSSPHLLHEDKPQETAKSEKTAETEQKD